MNHWGVLVLGLVVGVVGCSREPRFPTDGQIQVAPPTVQRDILPILGLDVPEIYSLIENEEGSFEISVNVPDDQFTISVLDMPQGAIFDAKLLKFSWTPSYGVVASDAGVGNERSKIIPIQFLLKSKTIEDLSVTKVTRLIVSNSPREIKLNFAPLGDGFTESVAGSQMFEVISEDFPQGPFEVGSSDLPEGASIVHDATDPKQFILNYTPPVNAAIFRDGSLNVIVKFINFNLSVTTPSGRPNLFSHQVRVKDERLRPLISQPSGVKVPLDGGVSVLAVDQNREAPPRVRLVTFPIQYGQVVMNSAAVGNATHAKFSFSNVPQSALGQKAAIRYEVCVHQNAWATYRYCNQHELEVEFVGDALERPLLDRKEFPAGTLPYYRHGQVIKLGMPIQMTSPMARFHVNIEPKSMSDQVSWNANTLELKTDVVGVHAFYLNIVTDQGAVVREGFLYEVLPPSWSDTLLINHHLASTESVYLKDLFSISGSMAMTSSPDLDRAFKLRSRAVIGTDLISQSGELLELETRIAALGQWAVFSPLIGMLKGSLANEIMSFGLKPLGRFSDVMAGESLSDFTLTPEWVELDKPALPLKLIGKLTLESASPLLWEVPPVGCETLISLENPANSKKAPVSVRCRRVNGDWAILSGVEWGDILVDPADNGILRKWLKRVIEK